MKTKIELAQQLTEVGITLPENWGKLSTARAGAWATIAMSERVADTDKAAKKTTGAFGKLRAAVGAALGSVLGSDSAAADAAEEKRKRDGGWKRYTGGNRGWYPASRRTQDFPEKLTRQIRRALERRQFKMPVGMKMALWHDMNKMPKAGPGRRGSF